MVFDCFAETLVVERVADEYYAIYVVGCQVATFDKPYNGAYDAL